MNTPLQLLAPIAALFFLLGTGAVSATGDNANTTSGGHPPYTCEKNAAGDFVCYCAGESDCEEMQDSGVCDVAMPELGPNASGNDTTCDTDFGGVGEHVCECTATLSSGVSTRPDAFNVPTENAPTESPRGRRGGAFEQLPDGTSNTASPSERSNETVPARRGQSPDQAPAIDEAPEPEEEAPSRTVRDHR